jgi:hypothetical protein
MEGQLGCYITATSGSKKVHREYIATKVSQALQLPHGDQIFNH